MILVISRETYDLPFDQTRKLRRSAKDGKRDKQMEYHAHVGSYCGAEITLLMVFDKYSNQSRGK